MSTHNEPIMAEHSIRRAFIEIHKIANLVAISGFIIALSFSSCMSSKRMMDNFPKYVHPREVSLEFIDSLKANKVDKIIGFYSGQVDGKPYSNVPYFVFWKSEDTWFTTKFTRKNKYNTLENYVPPIDFIETFLDTLQNENLDLPNFIQSAYGYDEVSIKIKEVAFDYKIKDYERQYNTDTYRVLLADSIKSILLNIPNEAWEAKDY